MPSVPEKLAEARRIAALFAAYGHPEVRRRILDIVDGPTEDSSRLEMLRYEAASIAWEFPPKDPLVLRLCALTEG